MASAQMETTPKRHPLAPNLNAVNSPIRTTVVGKRSRTTASGLRDAPIDLDAPSAKRRQVTDTTCTASRRADAGQGYDPERVSVAAAQRLRQESASLRTVQRTTHERDAQQQHGSRQVRHEPQRHKNFHTVEKPPHEEKEQVKEWRQHYQKIFPKFVFYLENLPRDTVNRALKAITYLGAREEKFFSLHVTHVITSRPIPNGPQDSQPGHVQINTRPTDGHGQIDRQVRTTINPVLLSKQSDGQHQQVHRSAQSTVELASQQRRPAIPTLPSEGRRQQTSQTDILIKARDMGKKIWSLEKFERVLETLLTTGSDESEPQPLTKAPPKLTRTNQDEDLKQLLRDEKQMPNAGLQWSSIVPFRQYFVYVHQADEKVKPIMIREYKKKSKDGDGVSEGDWPQLHSVAEPRCPFVAEKESSKGDDTENDPHAPEEESKRTRPALVRAMTAPEAKPAGPTAVAGRKRPLDIDMPREMAKPTQPFARIFEVPTQNHHHATNQSNTTDSLPPQSRFAFHGSQRPGVGREPEASGVQKSVQTSAIQSQMISSTAANPATRRPPSKAMNDLQKRALEQRRGLTTDTNRIRAAINAPASSTRGRESRYKKPDQLQKIHEDADLVEQGPDALAMKEQETHKRAQQEKSKANLKPGYCENCRDKYESFDDHIQEKTHRAFALKNENWTDLDHLLKKLARR